MGDPTDNKNQKEAVMLLLHDHSFHLQNTFYTKHKNMAVPCLLYNIKNLYKYLALFLGATHLTFVND